MRLFHFSDDPGIAVFEPRPVRVPSDRGPGMGWLNGPLVWTVTELRQGLYLFPRECPRIVLWLKDTTTDPDRERWFGASQATMIAHIEWSWLDRVMTQPIYRYELPVETFEPLRDTAADESWCAVSRETVTPIRVDRIDIPAAMREAGVELRVMERLTPLRSVWDTSLHASGIRLRNARDWA